MAILPPSSPTPAVDIEGGCGRRVAVNINDFFAFTAGLASSCKQFVGDEDVGRQGTTGFARKPVSTNCCAALPILEIQKGRSAAWCSYRILSKNESTIDESNLRLVATGDMARPPRRVPYACISIFLTSNNVELD